MSDSVPTGRVGRVTRGGWEGYFVLLQQYTDIPESWLLMWRDPRRELGTAEAVGDVAGDRIVPSAADVFRLVDELGVTWLTGAADRDAMNLYFSFPEPGTRRARKKG